MKKQIISVLFLCAVLAANAQHVIENPRYGISSTPYIELTKVELTDEATILSFHVKIPQNNWVAIHEKSYIQPVGDTTRLYVTKAEGAEIATQIQWEKVKREEIAYRLFFPPVDKKVTRIDFGEPVRNSWKFYDIEIREIPHKSPVSDELLGHWFSEADGQWTFSLLDSLAVFAGKIWKYEDVTPSGGGFTVNLINKQEKQTLFCQPGEGVSCTMRTGNTPPARFSKDVKMLDKISDPVPFDASSLTPGKVVYRGLIRGYSTRLGSQTGMIRLTNHMTNQQESHVIPIEKDGSFQVEFNLDFPREITVSLPSGNENLFFEPGKPIFHLANSGIKYIPSLFAGEGAALNYDLFKTKGVRTPSMSFIDGIKDMSDVDYIGHVLATREKELEALAVIHKENPLGSKALQIRQFDIHFRAFHNALGFDGNVNMSKILANRELPEEEKIPVEPLIFDMNLLSRFKDTPVHDELAVISNEYYYLLQTLKYTDLKRQQSAYYYRLHELGKELAENGTDLTGEEKDMLEYIGLNLIRNYDQEKSRNFNLSYREVVQKFTQKYQDEFLILSNRFYMENMETNLIAAGIKPEGLPVEFIRTQNYFAGLKTESTGLNEEDWQKIKTAIHTPFLKELLMATYYRKKAELEVQNSASAGAPLTEGDKLFNSIISPYKGKVIYVDFWATWCGPCLSGIERIKPLKEELAGKDIVFLYITNPTSPEADYKKKIPDIKGEHVRVTADEWNYLTAKFNIFGIPHYALVDKSGKIVNSHMMHLGNDALKEQLLKQLENQ